MLSNISTSEPRFFTLKIERARARVRLSGELRSEDLDQVKTEIQKCGVSAVLDLEEVNLADIECVHFLNGREAKGISVVHCSPYKIVDAAWHARSTDNVEYAALVNAWWARVYKTCGIKYANGAMTSVGV